MTKVTAAIIIKDRKVLIAKRKSTGRLPCLWEFPGGKIEPGESPEQCLKRELLEEFEIDVHIGDYLGNSLYKYDFGTIDLISYKVHLIKGDFKLNDHAEIACATASRTDMKVESYYYNCSPSYIDSISSDLHTEIIETIEVRRYLAKYAVMLVHSFSKTKEWLEDYKRFVDLYGVDGDAGKVVKASGLGDVELYLGWVIDTENYGEPDSIEGTVAARKCPHCGHHEIGIETEEGEFVPVRPGTRVKVNI